MEKPAVMSKIYNLTDVSTPTLVQYGLVAQHIAVGSRMIAPGEYAECDNTNGQLMPILEHLITVGAVSVDIVPPPYIRARQQLDAAAGGKPSNAPAHLTLPETKVVDPGPSQPVAETMEPSEAVAAVEEPKGNSRRR